MASPRISACMLKMSIGRQSMLQCRGYNTASMFGVKFSGGGVLQAGTFEFGSSRLAERRELCHQFLKDMRAWHVTRIAKEIIR